MINKHAAFVMGCIGGGMIGMFIGERLSEGEIGSALIAVIALVLIPLVGSALHQDWEARRDSKEASVSKNDL